MADQIFAIAMKMRLQFTHARMHARTHARTHTHTHTQVGTVAVGCRFDFAFLLPPAHPRISQCAQV